MNKEISIQIHQALTICKYELLMHFRKKKIFSMLGIAVGVGILFVVILDNMKPSPFIDESFLVSAPLIFSPFLIVLLASIFGSDSIVSEFKNKTGNTLFPNPVSKESIWLGKFLSAQLISILIILLYYTISITNAVIFSHKVGFEVILSLGFSFLSVTMVMSFAFLISSAFRGTTGATVLVFFLFLIILPMTDQILSNELKTKPWFSPTFSSEIIKNVLTVPYPSESNNMQMFEQFGKSAYIADINQSILVMVLYSAAAIIVSVLVFRRRELK